MDSFLHDFRYALRRLHNSLGFSSVAVITLALGIGANSAIFSVVNAVLLRPLPYRDPAQLVLLNERTPQFPLLSASYENYMDWRDQSRSFEAMGAVRNTTMTLTGNFEPERLTAQMATANLFDLLGVHPALGRTFLPEEDRAGAAGVVVISHGLWQRRFAASDKVLGQSIVLDNKPYSIIGVMPAGYQVMQQAPEVTVPFEPWAKTLPDDRNWHPGILPIARLKSGTSLEQARQEITAIAKHLEEQYPIYDTGVGATVNLMQEQLVSNLRPALLILLGAVGFVLLIACANVANLLLARAAARQREMAIRAAIGASRRRIVQQLLIESVCLALIGAGLGLLLAQISLHPLLQLAGSTLPKTADVHLDLWALAFTMLVAVLAGVLFGLAPALQISGVDVRDALSKTDRGGAGARSVLLRSGLVVTEVATAMLLLVGAGLLIRSFSRLSNISPGFQTDKLLIADLPVSKNGHPQSAERMEFFDRILDRAAALPGVRSVGAASNLPVSGAGGIIHFNIQGRPPKSPSEYVLANYRVVSPDYLKTIGVPLLAGREFTAADREKASGVTIINATMAKTYFPGQSPLGQHLQLGAMPDKDTPWMEVVGVVGDVKQGLSSEAPTEFYVPFRQGDQVLPVFFLSVVMRTAGDPMQLSNSFREAVRQIDPNQPVVKMRSMEQNVAESTAQPRFRTSLLTIFAGMALLLAAIGVYGVMAYSTAQRTREIGVRVALGARPADVLAMVLGHGLRLAVIGLILGILAALALTRYLSSLLFQVGATDPGTMLGVAALLVGVVVLACYLPARRATRVDPMVALRYE